MSTGLAQDFKEQVRAATNIVALIGESLTLTPHGGGREYKGLCPFHHDTNPSLTISPERQSYKCWACGEGGDCFSWVEKMDGLTFPEAVRFLAERAGLEVPAYSREKRGPGGQTKNDLYDILGWAATQFHQFLLTAAGAELARKYLAGRGFTEETIKKYRLGFHPDNWEWLIDRARGKFATEQLLAARLIAERSNGAGYRDNFVSRVMFPVCDERGRVVAFGGRILPELARENDAKYINSADSPVFSKSKLVYGLDLAREAIRQRDEAIVVEGYTDCIMAAQAGVQNAVAILGTALTELHVQLLRRFCRKVVLVLDGDAAGQGAAVRSLGKFLAQDVDLRILPLPAKQDPAEFLEAHGADEFLRRAENAVEAWEFKLQTSIQTHTLESMDSRHRVLEDMLDLLAAAPRLAGTVREDMLLSRITQLLQVPERKTRQRLDDLRRQPSGNVRTTSRPENENTPRPETVAPVSRQDAQLECELLEIVFAHPELLEAVRQTVSLDDLKHNKLRELFTVCCDVAERDGRADCPSVMTAVDDPALKRLAIEIDERAQKKQTAEKLRSDGSLNEVPAPSSLFGQVIARWRFRHQQPATGPPDTAAGGQSAGLTADAKARLRQITQLRQADPHTRLKSPTGRKR